MPEQSRAHDYLEWTEQKLAEIDAVIVTITKSAETVKNDIRAEADRVIGRIRTRRDAFKAEVDILRADVAAARKVADANYALLEAEWTEVELAFYDYIAVASGHASIIKQALAARAEAQRKSWQSSLQAIRVTASQAIDDARAEGEAAIRRVAAETDKAEAKLGKASAVGGESWKIIKDGLEEARSVYDQAWKKISTAFLKDR